MNAVARDVDYAAIHLVIAGRSTSRGLLDGPQACEVVANLAELVGRVPVLLDFLSLSLRRTHAEDHYDDRGRDSADALGLGLVALLDVNQHVTAALRALNTAHNHLGHLGRHLPED